MEQVNFLALVSFLARSEPKVPFLGLSLLRNQTETLARLARLALVLNQNRQTSFRLDSPRPTSSPSPFP